MSDSTPKIVGIGGIFFSSADKAATRSWYAKHLGMELDDFGLMFQGRDIDDADTLTYLQWSVFSEGDPHFAPSKEAYMINYRVVHIEAFVEKLRAEGVTILDEIASYPYGKFVHIMDADGRKIELWEPANPEASFDGAPS